MSTVGWTPGTAANPENCSTAARANTMAETRLTERRMVFMGEEKSSIRCTAHLTGFILQRAIGGLEVIIDLKKSRSGTVKARIPGSSSFPRAPFEDRLARPVEYRLPSRN